MSTDGHSVYHLFELLKEKLQEDSPSVQYVAGLAQTRGVVLRKWISLGSSITTEVATSTVDVDGGSRGTKVGIPEMLNALFVTLQKICSLTVHSEITATGVYNRDIAKYCETSTPARDDVGDSLRH